MKVVKYKTSDISAIQLPNPRIIPDPGPRRINPLKIIPGSQIKGLPSPDPSNPHPKSTITNPTEHRNKTIAKTILGLVNLKKFIVIIY